MPRWSKTCAYTNMPMFDVWLFLSLKNIPPHSKCVCLNVEVWLFDSVFGTIAGSWSLIFPLWHAGLLVWVWSWHCVGKFLFCCHYEQKRTRQNTKVALSALKCVNWTETHAAVVITRQRAFPTAWLHTCCPFRLHSQWKGFPRILT